MSKEMLINMVQGQECRIAVMRDGVLEELYVERVSRASHVGNIYKGRVNNVEPSIQAAFVDFGLEKNGFLHISDVHPKYFPHKGKDGESIGHKQAHHQRPPIQKCLHRGQELVVQLTKEGIGTKGPTLTTYLSIPGRLLVMMPYMSRLGVSRKIEDEALRNKAREILGSLKLPDDMGFILRTAGMDSPKREFQRDLNYLTALWQTISRRIKNSKTPAEIYQESDLVTRTIRDVYNSDIDRIICDTEAVTRKVNEFLKAVMPRTRHNIELYTEADGLFHAFGLESEIEKIHSRRVELASGGSLVIDQTEALVAIDVNSGRYREHSDAETTARKINIEAAGEIARQLRLRDMGGVIIIDFIDMREERNRRAVEKAIKDAIKPDRAKTKLLRISRFGIVEMTRQRMRPSLKDSFYRRCNVCDGTGLAKSEESVALAVMRNLQRAVAHKDVARIEVAVSPAVAEHLANVERKSLTHLEVQTHKHIVIRPDPDRSGEDMELTCTNNRGNKVTWQKQRSSGGQKKVKTINVNDLPPGKAQQAPAAEAPAKKDESPPAEGDAKKKSKPRRRRRGGRKHKKKHPPAPEAAQTSSS